MLPLSPVKRKCGAVLPGINPLCAAWGRPEGELGACTAHLRMGRLGFAVPMEPSGHVLGFAQDWFLCPNSGHGAAFMLCLWSLISLSVKPPGPSWPGCVSASPRGTALAGALVLGLLLARHPPRLARGLLGHSSVPVAVSSTAAQTQLMGLLPLASSSLPCAELGALPQSRWLWDLPKPG